MEMSNRLPATALARLGYYIFPIRQDGKIPLVKWSTESTCSVLAVDSWWSSYPHDNIGIDTGRSGLLVVDLDSTEAALAFQELWDKHEPGEPSLVVATRRGWHLYFDATARHLRNTAGKLGCGIDTRGGGGMVIAPGSMVQGVPYEVVSGNLSDVPALPDWLYRRLRPKPQTVSQRREKTHLFKPSTFQAQRALRQWCAKIISAPHGEQNTRINLAAFVLGRDFCPPLDIDEVREQLQQAAEEGNHPRVRAVPTIRSGLQGKLYE